MYRLIKRLSPDKFMIVDSGIYQSMGHVKKIHGSIGDFVLILPDFLEIYIELGFIVVDSQDETPF